MAKFNVATRKQVEELKAKTEEVKEIIAEIGGRAQNKKYTEFKSGVVGTANITITGCGRIQFWPLSTNSAHLTLSVDGVSVASGSTPFGFDAGTTEPQLEVYFEKSVVFKASTDSRIGYFAET